MLDHNHPDNLRLDQYKANFNILAEGSLFFLLGFVNSSLLTLIQDQSASPDYSKSHTAFMHCHYLVLDCQHNLIHTY